MRGAALSHDPPVTRTATPSPARESSPSPAAAACIFLSIPSGHNVANLLRSGFFPALLESGARVVILSPFASDPAFVEEFRRDRVEIVPLAPWHPTPAERVVDSALSERFLRATKLRAVRLQRDRARLLDPWRGRSALAAAKSLIVRAPVTRPLWYRVAVALSHAPDIEALFAHHRPALVVTASAGFLTAEVPLIYAARRAGVPTLGVDLGWDNLVSKYHTIVPVDRLAVWNDEMREQAIRYHGFAPGSVSVAGAVQFDPYFEELHLPARDAFIAGAHGDPQRALITVATAPYSVYPSTPWLIDIVARAIADDALGRPAQLLVRVHPRDDLALYSHLAGRPHVVVEKPVAHLHGTEGTPKFDQFSATQADRRHLAATLAHSDVLVNFASTTTIEACVFDTPVINIGFDEQADLAMPLSIRRYFEFEHYQPVVETGAATIASSPAALLDALRAYLADGARHSGARKELIARLYPFRDGGSGRRLADVVLDSLARRIAAAGAR
jgi:hypothetical protein